MKPWVAALAVAGGVLLVAPLFVRLFFVEPFEIPAGSMLPTLEIGDHFFVDKTEREPVRGAVMVFTVPVEPHHDYVKRVIAVGGDEVAVRGGVVSVNGQPLARKPLGRETFWDRDTVAGEWMAFEAEVWEEKNGDFAYRVLAEPDDLMRAPDFGPITVPPGHVFFLGDNRDHSFDSRAWGPAPEESIIGTASTIWYSAGPNGVRNERVFERVQ